VQTALTYLARHGFVVETATGWRLAGSDAAIIPGPGR
jgi:hypothetical protein